MKCCIYKSGKKEGVYLYICHRDDFSKVPDALYQSMGKPVFVMDLELSSERRLASEDPTEVLQSLREKGYHLQLPPVYS